MSLRDCAASAGMPRLCPGCRSRDGEHDFGETCTLAEESDALYAAIGADIAALDVPPVAEPVPPPSDPWLARRALGFGASDVAALLVALGRRHAEDFPAWVRDAAKPIRTRAGIVPRVLARKAGLAAYEAPSAVALEGIRRERELYSEAYRQARVAPWVASPGLDPESLTYAPDAIPRECLPLVDRYERALSATPDAWARDLYGGLVCVELKCSVQAVLHLPPHYALQVQAQIAVMGAESGLLVVGQQWGASWAPDGPIAAWPVERDDAVIAEIREAAAEGWRRVCALREEAGHG